MNWNMISQFVLARAKESATWASVAAGLTAAGASAPWPWLQAGCLSAAGVCAMAGMFVKEAGATWLGSVEKEKKDE